MALTPIGNVVLLLHCDDTAGSTTLADASPYGLNGKCYGTAATSAAQSMFGGLSLLTGNANGNYAAVGTNQLLDFGAGDFTVELFVYPVSQGSDGGAILGRWNGTANDMLLMRAADGSMQVLVNGAQVLQTSAGDLPLNQFTHVALTRQAGTLNAWIGGNSKGSYALVGAINFTRGTPLYLGQSNLSGGATWLQAYFDEIRVTMGLAQYTANFTPPPAALSIDTSVDPAWSNVVSLMHFDGNSGSTLISDECGKSWTVVGATTLSATQSKFGGSALQLPGSNSYAATLDSPDFNFGSGDFTVECQVYALAVSSPQVLFGKRASNAPYAPFILFIWNDGSIYGFCSTDGSTWQSAKGGSVSANAWHHVAMVRKGTTVTAYLDGVSVLSFPLTGSVMVNTSPVYLGGDSNASFLNGYMDEFRATKGAARYTANFTPPAAPFWNPAKLAFGARLKTAYLRPRFWLPSPSKPQARTYKPNVLRLRDFLFGGTGKVAGTVDVSPNTSVSRKVWLLDERCMLPVRSTWSDPVTGAYQFSYIDPTRTYTVQAYDYTKTYRAVIANGVVPDQMP